MPAPELIDAALELLLSGSVVTLEDAQADVVCLIADSMEEEIHTRADALRARWEGGAQA